MKRGSCDVSDIFRKQIFDFKVLRRDKKKRPDCKTIHSHITQHSTTNLDENSLLNAIKFLIEENVLKNTPTKAGDSYYVFLRIVALKLFLIPRRRNAVKNTQLRMDPSNGKVPKLGETSTQNVKEHESPEKITNSILQVEFVMGENF